MRADGSHTHHDHRGPSGLGLALSIAAGLVLASVIESILAILLIVLAVVAGLIILGLVSQAIATWYSSDPVPPGADHLPLLSSREEEQTEMLVMPGTAVALPAETHQHLHFHGLDPAQVAAILAARQYPPGDQDGEAW